MTIHSLVTPLRRVIPAAIITSSRPASASVALALLKRHPEVFRSLKAGTSQVEYNVKVEFGAVSADVPERIVDNFLLCAEYTI